MRAWRLHSYGGPEGLTLDDVPIPAPAPGELLVRLRVASINPVDWKTREGMVAKFFPIEFPRTLGRDGVGEVVGIGAGVTDWRVGDRVLGVAIPGRDGTHAEFACFDAAASAPVPSTVADDAAVCLGIAGLSAYIALVEVAALQAGERILIHAAAGGVGGVAVQIARRLGADVIGTCSRDNADYVRGLGASRTIDYRHDDFVAAAGPCDVVLDTIGGAVHQRSAEVLEPGGRLVYLSAAPVEPVARSDVSVTMARVSPTRARFDQLLDWVVTGAIRPQVGQRFPLAELPAAYASSQSTGTRGKLILVI